MEGRSVDFNLPSDIFILKNNVFPQKNHLNSSKDIYFTVLFMKMMPVYSFNRVDIWSSFLEIRLKIFTTIFLYEKGVANEINSKKLFLSSLSSSGPPLAFPSEKRAISSSPVIILSRARDLKNSRKYESGLSCSWELGPCLRLGISDSSYILFYTPSCQSRDTSCRQSWVLDWVFNVGLRNYDPSRRFKIAGSG